VSDEINLTAGDNAEDVAAGKRNTQQNPRQQARSDPNQNITIQGGSDDDKLRGIWREIDRHAALIIQHTDRINDILDRLRELRTQMDNLPDKVQELIVQMDRQKDKVQNLENRAMEVVVRPGKADPEVIIRPTSNYDALTTNQLGLYMMIGFAVVLAIVLYLVWLQAVR